MVGGYPLDLGNTPFPNTPSLGGLIKNFHQRQKTTGDPYVFILGGLRFFERAKKSTVGTFMIFWAENFTPSPDPVTMPRQHL